MYIYILNHNTTPFSNIYYNLTTLSGTVHRWHTSCRVVAVVVERTFPIGDLYGHTLTGRLRSSDYAMSPSWSRTRHTRPGGGLIWLVVGDTTRVQSL